MNNKPFALIGAELRGNDVHANYERNSELRLDLVNLGLSFVGVTNVSRKGISSQVFIVETSDELAIAYLARKYEQKSILVSKNGTTEVVATKSSNGRKSLGKFESVTKAIATKASFHIKFIDGGREYFYITTKG